MERIGVIGGSGLYQLNGITDVREINVRTPFGRPSDSFIVGLFEGREVVFLPRHGRGHRISPTEVNYRANIFAMKKLGVSRIISVAACGSLNEAMKPLDFVLVDQFVDRTNQGRKMTFFENGIVAHVMFSKPVCADLAATVYASGKKLNLTMHSKGTYLNMEGPAFSTKAESNLYRSWGMDIIGMTNMSEARLAREAEICYCSLACVTDYDCWHSGHDTVSVDMVIANVVKNTENARKILAGAIKALPQENICSCRRSLEHAIMTDRARIPGKIKKDIDIIIGKYVR